MDSTKNDEIVQNDNDPYRIQLCANESHEQAVQFQKLMFEVTQRRAEASGVPHFFVVTRELHSELHYGFVSNVPYSKLAKLSQNNNNKKDNKDDLISWFRSEFIGGFERGGLLRKVCDALTARDNGEFDGVYVLLIKEDRNRLPSVYYNNHGEKEDSPPESIEKSISKIKQVDEQFMDRLKLFKKGVDGNDGSGCYLIAIRRENPLPSDVREIRRRKPKLVQLAVVYESEPHTISYDPEFISELNQWMDVSSISTYAVLYERERYFSKALRQAAQGMIIKWGVADEIKSQAIFLKNLGSPIPSHVAPVILKQDEWKHGEKVSWYEMPKYAMPRMLDLLVSTEGFSQYEIVSLGRTCYEHLERFFWKELFGYSPGGNDKGVSSALMAGLVIARGAANYSVDKIKARWELIESNEPVKMKKRLVVLNNADIGKLNGGLKNFFNGKSLEVCLSLDPNNANVHKLTLKPPQVLLDEVFKDVTDYNDICSQEIPLVLIAQGAQLHGDPHFENLFIDASVPEDPLIVAIDPIKLTEKKFQGYWTELDERMDLNGTLDNAIYKKTETRFISACRDPAYDVAKFLLSTTSLYGLIIRGAYRLNTNEGLIIEWSGDTQIKPFAGDGGISGAGIVEKTAPAVKEAWRNHNTITKAIVEVYVNRILDALNKYKEEHQLNDDSIECALNVALINLWAFTLRHTFSIAEKIFPEQAEKSLVIYLLGSCLTQRGCKIVKKALEHEYGLADPEVKNDLQSLFLPENLGVDNG